jgi:hypothetical protein
VVFCNRRLLRCERQECDEYRLLRNRQKEASASTIAFGSLEEPPGATVEDKMRFYNEPGFAGFDERVRIVRELLDAGFDEREAAEEVLWSVSEMRRALGSEQEGLRVLRDEKRDVA